MFCELCSELIYFVEKVDEKEKICKFEYKQRCFSDDLSKSIHTSPGIPALWQIFTLFNLP